MADDFIRSADAADKKHKKKIIDKIKSKSCQPPPGGGPGKSDDSYVINLRESALLHIDGIPVLRLYIPNLPRCTMSNHMKKFFTKTHHINVSVFVMRKSRFTDYAFIDCLNLEDSAHIQLLSKEHKLIYRHKNLRVFPANASNQRSLGNSLQEPTIEVDKSRRETELDMDNIDIAQKLPIEILNKIFENLPLGCRMICQQVCRHWQAAAMWRPSETYFDLSSEYLWGDSSKKKLLTTSQLIKIAKQCNSVNYGWQQVIISSTEYTAKFLRAGIAEFLIALTPDLVSELNLSGTTISQSTLRYISESFHHLKSFALGDCYGPHDAELRQIISHNSLEAFGIIHDHNSSGEFLESFFNSDTLISFTAISCSKLRSPAINLFLNSAKRLRYLHIALCSNLIEAIADDICNRNNIEIEYLYLENTGSKEFSHFWRNAMIQRLQIAQILMNNVEKNFKSLSLANNTWLNVTLIGALSTDTQIRHLDLSGCFVSEDWWTILSFSNTLTSLAINELVCVSEHSDPQRFSTFTNFHTLQNKLEHLEFRNYVMKRLPKGILQFFENNHILKQLDLRNCSYLNNFNFLKINGQYRVRNRSQPKLKVFTWRTKLKYDFPMIEIDGTPYERPEALPTFRLRL